MRLVPCLIVTLFSTPAFIQGDGQENPVTPPPLEVVKALELDSFYSKYLDASGIAIVASSKVNDFALIEARYLIDQMLGDRDDLRQAIAAAKVRFGIMAVDEFTTDLPEHADLSPAGYWDKRARGLGATDHRPCVSCGEENLLAYVGDPYATENILIHEFAHVIHGMGMNRIDSNFQARLENAYHSALDAGLWEGKYAAQNPSEYWAEGVQSWFDTNRENDHDHNHVNTRDELIVYDPDLSKLIEEVLGTPDWRYVNPRDRTDPMHLRGYDQTKSPQFEWPKHVLDAWRAWEESEAKDKEP